MFNKQHIVITGGSSGLGLEMSRRLVKEGARLSLIARNMEKLEAAKQELQALDPNAQVQVYSVDVSNEDATKETMQKVADANGGIDILVNSAGVLLEGEMAKSSMDDYRYIMEINYFGLINACKAALPYLLKSKGKIVNIASVAGLTGPYGYSSYSGSKHAVIGFSESIRSELKPEGVTVQVVCPGEFDTPMVDNMDAAGRSEENKAVTALIPKASCEFIAQKTLDGMRGNHFMIVTGGQTKVMAFNIRHFPAISRMLGDYVVKKVRSKKA